MLYIAVRTFSVLFAFSKEGICKPSSIVLCVQVIYIHTYTYTYIYMYMYMYMYMYVYMYMPCTSVLFSVHVCLWDSFWTCHHFQLSLPSLYVSIPCSMFHVISCTFSGQKHYMQSIRHILIRTHSPRAHGNLDEVFP